MNVKLQKAFNVLVVIGLIIVIFRFQLQQAVIYRPVIEFVDTTMAWEKLAVLKYQNSHLVVFEIYDTATKGPHYIVVTQTHDYVFVLEQQYAYTEHGVGHITAGYVVTPFTERSTISQCVGTWGKLVYEPARYDQEGNQYTNSTLFMFYAVPREALCYTTAYR